MFTFRTCWTEASKGGATAHNRLLMGVPNDINRCNDELLICSTHGLLQENSEQV